MIYQDGSVSIDTSFARFGSKSYAVKQINTVDVRARQVRGKGWGALWLLIGVICIAQGWSKPGGGEGAGTGVIVFGAVLVGVAALLLRRPNIYEYDLMLRTSSGEAQAYTTKDAATIGRLRAAIEQAISAR